LILCQFSPIHTQLSKKISQPKFCLNLFLRSKWHVQSIIIFMI
jgi:hypothetical protein